MPNVNISIVGNPKYALILGYAFKTDNIADILNGADYTSANKLLLEYGATITNWNRNCDGGQTDELQVTALSDDDFREALDKVEEYKSWMVATAGSYDTYRLSDDKLAKLREREPCPVALDTISRNLMRLNPNTFRVSLYRIFDTDEYKLQLWDWMHTGKYAPLFTYEECPILDSIPRDMVCRYFSLP
jgi:hypothetical protein